MYEFGDSPLRQSHRASKLRAELQLRLGRTRNARVLLFSQRMLLIQRHENESQIENGIMGYPVFVPPFSYQLYRWVINQKDRLLKKLPKGSKAQPDAPIDDMQAEPVNPWTLDKHTSVKRFLILMQTEFESHSYAIDTRSASDPSAFVLVHRRNPGIRAHVYSCDQRFGVDLEVPTPYVYPPKRLRLQNLTFDQAIAKLKDHMELQARQKPAVTMPAAKAS